MKKKGIIFFMILLVFATSVFATPGDKEVGDALMGVASVHFATTLQAAMGAVDSRYLTIKKDEDKGTITYIFKNYPTKEMNDRRTAGGKEAIPFTHLSGKIIAKGSVMSRIQNYTYDVTFRGGKLRSLYYKIEGVDPKSNKETASIVMKVNGRKYSDAEVERLHKNYQSELEKSQSGMPNF